MYKDIFENINNNYQDFYDTYIKFYMERFIYSNTEIEGITLKDERKIFVNLMLEAFNLVHNHDGLLDPALIKKVGSIVNYEQGLDGFRKINVYAGDFAAFNPPPSYQIYPLLFSLLDNYYHVWNELDPFLREAMFHINFMRIHPFEDGNKRCAKIILANNLLKSYEAPVIITEEDNLEYYKFINDLDYEGFAEFLRQRSKIELDTLVSLFKMKYNIPMDETPPVFQVDSKKR